MDYPNSCHQKIRYCPLRIHELDKEFPTCTFYDKEWDLIEARQFKRIPALLDRACELLRTEELRSKSIRKASKMNVKEFLKNVKIGDTVYCFRGDPYYLEVRLLEIRDSGRCRCQRVDGKLFYCDVVELRRILNGTSYGEYLITHTDNNKEKARELEYWARYYGFRTEVEEKNNDDYILKIYGNSQQEIDDFIELFIIQRRVLTL